MATAKIGDVTIADSGETQMVEGNHYFPPGAIDNAVLEPSDHRTFCGWKGEASYYHVVIDGKRYENAAWYYPEPLEKAAHIKDHVAFYPVVTVG
ncbi:MAG: DUF427 domain-containing protein [Myxococcota bacterium]